jgi:hypothetical protein
VGAAADLYLVERRCRAGECPVSDGVCACLEPVVAVDVDELVELEVRAFALHGTAAQRADLQEYFGA